MVCLEQTLLGAAAFWDTALEVVAAAKKKVFVASFVYDNSKLQTKLLAALTRGVKVEILVDRVNLSGAGGAPKAEQRLKKLKEKGAKVYLASGKPYKQVFGREGRPGVYHVKAVVVDGAVSLTGSSNSTNSSQVNGEMVVKVTGSAEAAADAYAVAWAEAQKVGSL
jgi:phosphatidylserine/phosphatidylglycerophosphate/cardiolipin synthase-like enzyme